MVRNDQLPDIGKTATELAAYIDGLVKRKNVTQTAIGKALGNRAQSYVSLRLNGKRAWTLDELDKIAPLVGYPNAVLLITSSRKELG